MRVIVAIDQTNNWRQIIDDVLKRRWPEYTIFRVLTVVQPIEWQDLEALESREVLNDVIKARRSNAEHILEEARALIAKTVANCSVHIDLREGSPRSEILDAAIDWMADKIVLGAHGHAPNRLLPATVSRAVAQHALCSVELVRIKEQAPAADKETKKQAARACAN